MTIEAILERIAVALEKNNELLARPTVTFDTLDLETRKKHMLRQAEEIMANEKKKAEEKAEKERPKYDFNKEVRGPYVDLLQNVAKSRLGPKETTKLARKLLKAFTGQIEEVLSIKTLPEDKYEDFLAAVKDYKSQILNDKYQPIED